MSRHYPERACDAGGHKRKAIPAILTNGELPPAILAAPDAQIAYVPAYEPIDTAQTSAVIVDELAVERYSSYLIALDIQPGMRLVAERELDVPEVVAGLPQTLAVQGAAPEMAAQNPAEVPASDGELPNGGWGRDYLISAIDRLRWPFVELTRFDPGFAILARPRRRASDRWAAELQPG